MNNEMMSCPFCGASISTESTFCPYCGQRIAPKTPEPDTSAQEEVARLQREQEEAARRQREQEESARRQREQEEAARRQREQEEVARRQREQEEAARRQREQEEAARRQREQQAQQEPFQGAAVVPPQQSFATDENKDLTVMGILSEGIPQGLAKFGTVFGATILWLLTIWIPYLNVGTTIAIKTMPVSLAGNDELSGPAYIFDGSFRKYMGEYFTLMGLKNMSLWPAYLFFVIPGIIISLGWSQALYLLFDKHITPSDALMESNERTFNHKMTMFLAGVLFNVGFFIVAGLLIWLVSLMDVFVITFIIILLVIGLYMVASVGCQAVIYRKLCK